MGQQGEVQEVHAWPGRVSSALLRSCALAGVEELCQDGPFRPLPAVKMHELRAPADSRLRGVPWWTAEGAVGFSW